MKHKIIKFCLLCALVGMLLTGCDSGKPQQEVEVATPTGCLKSQGRYYDPKIKDCVKVDNDQQALELDAYRQVNQIAEKGELTEGEYNIGFSTYISLNKAEELWAELRDQNAKMLGVFGRLPDSVPGGCGWHYSFDAPSEENTIKEMLLKNIETIEANPALSGPAPELRKAIFEDNRCRIYSMWLTANPAVVRDFWNRHLDEIQGIRPRVDFLDKAMPAFGPLYAFTEEQV